MNVTLKNDLLTVVIEHAGAQLASVKNNAGAEYIWKGDPTIWGRHAPLLFPIISRLKDNQYTLNGKTYTIPQHGFARNMVFDLKECSDTRAVFTLTDDEKTREVFPFSFLLTVTYELEGTDLKKSIAVENRSGEKMFYEVGIHDGFTCPHSDEESMADWAVVIPGEDTFEMYGMDDTAMITPKDRTVHFPGGRISTQPMVTHSIDTFIMDSPACHKAMLVNKQGDPVVTMDFPGFPFLGIWTTFKDFETRYICIEPWSTLPDCTFVGRGLDEKKGIRSLEPGAQETLSYTTTFHV